MNTTLLPNILIAVTLEGRQDEEIDGRFGDLSDLSGLSAVYDLLA